jgi:hypothetical protein
MQRELDIRVVSGVSAGDVFHFELSPDKSVSIGRDPSSTVVLQDPRVSRNHATIRLQEGYFTIVDEGSSHGTVHMGFRLEPGVAAGRRLASGDEFKIGDSIFSVHFKVSSAVPIEEKKISAARPGATVGLKRLLQGRFKWYILLLLLLLLMLLAAPEEKGFDLPKQKSKQALTFPERRVIGYWPGKKSDRSHLDKAQFVLPAVDQVVEYEIVTETPIKLYVGQELVETIPPHVGSWQKRAVIVRDVFGGSERKLIFDNPDYPRAKGSKQAKLKRWKIWNVRTSPISRFVESSFDKQLAETASILARVDTSPDTLFLALRAVQRSVVEDLAEARLEALGYEISLELSKDEEQDFDVSAAVGEIEKIIKERSETRAGAATAVSYLKPLGELAADIDARLWRRVNSRMMRARLASQAGNYGVAYASLKSAIGMFPDEGDYRAILARKLFENNKIVPKKVRDKPRRYLRKIQGDY